MKYRRLTTEELHELEPEFVRFLASAQITAQDWDSMKTHSPQKADELLDIFSDLILDGAMSNIHYLVLKERTGVRAFCFEDDGAHMKSVQFSGTEMDIECTDISQMLALFKNEKVKIKLISGEKTFDKKTANEEKFHLLQMGAEIEKDGKFYDQICRLFK